MFKNYLVLLHFLKIIFKLTLLIGIIELWNLRIKETLDHF